MLPHVDVHRRSHHNRSGSCQIKSSQKIGSQSLSEFPQNISRRRHHGQRINRLRHRNMLHGRIDIGLLVPRRKHIRNHFFARQSSKREGPYKLLRRPRHNHLHANSALLQQAHNFRRFISRNPAADAQSNLHGNVYT